MRQRAGSILHFWSAGGDQKWGPDRVWIQFQEGGIARKAPKGEDGDLMTTLGEKKTNKK